MFIAHLPAGYIATVLSRKKWPSKTASSWFAVASCVGSVAPDFDLIYYYVWDKQQHHHHGYWTHYPIIWFPLLVFMLLLIKLFPRFHKPFICMAVFFFSGCVHLLLDTVVGDIWWGAPFIDKSFSLFYVPAIFSPWWLNFILHWSFLLELIIVFIAIRLWRQS